MNVSTTRISMADWAKALAIYLVVMSHTTISRPIANWAFMVEIPLFFFMSGFLFRFDRHPIFKVFAIKRFRQIIIPYVTINIVTYLFWLIVARHYGADSNNNISIWQPLTSLLTANSTGMVHNATMYFFTTLFNIEIVYYILFKHKRCIARILTTLLFVTLGGIDYYLNSVELPFSISHTLVGIVFYSLGCETRNSKTINTFMSNNAAKAVVVRIFIAILLFAVSLILLRITGAVNLQKREYAFYPLYFIETTIAIFSVIMLFSAASTVPRLIKQISANTLWICGYHLLTFTLLKGLLVYVLGIDISKLESTIMPNIFFSLAALFVCLYTTLFIKAVSRPNA